MPKRKIASIALVFFILGAFARAENKDQRAQELIERASQVSLIASKTAYHETVKFVIHQPSHTDVSGTFRRDYLDQMHYRERLISADYDEVLVVSGDKGWRNDPGLYPPATLIALKRHSPPLGAVLDIGSLNWKVETISRSNFGGTDLECIEYQQNAQTICFASDGTLATEKTPGQTTVYSQYQLFAGTKVPGHFDVTTSEGAHLEADVEFSPGSDIRLEMFEPPLSAGLTAVTPPVCPVGGRAPKLKTAADPAYPDGGKSGTVVLSVVVGTDGKTHDLRVVRSVAPANDREAIYAVKQWRFVPATCGGQPQNAQINVEVNFNIIRR